MRRRTATVIACFAAAGTCAAPGTAAAAEAAAPSFFTQPGELLGRTLRFRGAVGPELAGRTVQVQRQQPDGSWADTATAVVASDGSFLARWRPDAVGSFTVRALVAGAEAQAAASAPMTTNVTIYRPARATWFGPGFYGKRTACGQVMSRALLGVAHRTLPCGTPVAVFYRGEAVTVPVVDRGPFANGARYDLTSATAQSVGMTETTMIGVIAQRGAQMAPPAPPAPLPYAGTGGTTPP